MTTQSTEIIAASGLTDSPFDESDVRIVPMPRMVQLLMPRGVSAITLGSTIMIRPDRYERALEGEEAELVAHELIHVEQWRRYGPVGFLRRYLLDYARLRMIGLTHDQAYRGIGFEHDAYTRAKRMNQVV